MKLLDTLQQLIANPDANVDPQWTDAMALQYPYMSLPAILELRRNPDIDPDRRSHLLRVASATTPLPEVLHTIAQPDALDPTNFYPSKPATPSMSTDEVIDSFITRYGPNEASNEETAVLERLIFNPTPDYSTILQEEEERSLPSEDEARGDNPDALINAFILKSRRHRGQSSFPAPSDSISPERPEPIPVDTDATPVASPADRPDESMLSESLAKIYIKRQQYQRAHEIISTLNLKYPQKSVYFADQLRFLQKLIINQQFLNKKTTK